MRDHHRPSSAVSVFLAVAGRGAGPAAVADSSSSCPPAASRLARRCAGSFHPGGVPKLLAGSAVARAVLVVDDDPPLLKLLSTLVGREPQVEVVACRDGEEAILQLSRRHFDVVLLDLMMPRRNGFDVIDFLREHRPAQLRVVLVLTAPTDDFTRRLDPSAVHAVIAKPFDTRAVLDLVHTVLSAADAMS